MQQNSFENSSPSGEELSRIVEKLRARQSAYIHDELAGRLEAIRRLSELAEEDPSLLENIQALAEEAEASVRAMEEEIKPMSEFTLEEGMRRIRSIAEARDAEIHVRVSAEGPEGWRLSEDQKTGVLSTAREIVRNACHHGSDPIFLSFVVGDKYSLLDVTDSGPGFEPGDDKLVYCRSRASRLGGWISTYSEGEKTTVIMEFPTQPT
jgi:signal transduction histidine kinase